jgi:4-hydroxy-tetrahydrodipicolinate synthase
MITALFLIRNVRNEKRFFMFTGSYVALITPFKQGVLDLEALCRLVEWHIEEGTDGLVPCGATGENFLLTPQEQKIVIRTITEIAKKRIQVIAGTSAISTTDTLSLIRQAEEFDIDGLMIVTPPYIKPTQAAIFEFYKTVSEESNTPIIVYDNPARSGVPIKDETILQLSTLKNIACLKDASGNLIRPAELEMQLPVNFTLLSGEDDTVFAFLAQGGKGIISVTANVAPRLVSEQCKAWESRDFKRVTEIRRLLTPLHKARACESVPVPVKYGASLLGLCRAEVRLPLQPITPTGAQQVEDAMVWAGLLPAQKASHG